MDLSGSDLAIELRDESWGSRRHWRMVGIVQLPCTANSTVNRMVVERGYTNW